MQLQECKISEWNNDNNNLTDRRIL
uniref:Uncharacterized protein n=1 Tax=Anguilla anguilla TaxID=7936 RepID=A0A0E9QQ64_ANGAN